MASGQQGYLVLFQGDVPLQVRHQGRRAGVLHLCLLIGYLGGQTAVEAEFGLTDALAPGFQGTEDDVQLVVQGSEFEVCRSDCGHEGHLHGPLRLDGGKVLGHGCPVSPAEAAEQIHFP